MRDIDGLVKRLDSAMSVLYDGDNLLGVDDYYIDKYFPAKTMIALALNRILSDLDEFTDFELYIYRSLKKDYEKFIDRTSNAEYYKEYYDPDTGNSVRATEGHFLICFDECPEIGEQVEKMFNKKRMVS